MQGMFIVSYKLKNVMKMRNFVSHDYSAQHRLPAFHILYFYCLKSFFLSVVNELSKPFIYNFKKKKS